MHSTSAKSSLAPPVTVPALAFPVSAFIAIGNFAQASLAICTRSCLLKSSSLDCRMKENQSSVHAKCHFGYAEAHKLLFVNIAIPMIPPRKVETLCSCAKQFHLRLFIAGSPLGIFLTLRKVNPAKGRCLGSQEAAGMMPGDTDSNGDGLPAVQRMYNLYHPFDPVGFR